MEVWDDVGHFPNLEDPARFLETLRRIGEARTLEA
jgi:pimeloyl-ACP methyl ester carboxylesterase